jgi:hypothetical protein
MIWPAAAPRVAEGGSTFVDTFRAFYEVARSLIGILRAGSAVGRHHPADPVPAVTGLGFDLAWLGTIRVVWRSASSPARGGCCSCSPICCGGSAPDDAELIRRYTASAADPVV